MFKRPIGLQPDVAVREATKRRHIVNVARDEMLTLAADEHRIMNALRWPPEDRRRQHGDRRQHEACADDHAGVLDRPPHQCAFPLVFGASSRRRRASHCSRVSAGGASIAPTPRLTLTVGSTVNNPTCLPRSSRPLFAALGSYLYSPVGSPSSPITALCCMQRSTFSTSFSSTHCLESPSASVACASAAASLRVI